MHYEIKAGKLYEAYRNIDMGPRFLCNNLMDVHNVYTVLSVSPWVSKNSPVGSQDVMSQMKGYHFTQ